MALVMSYDDECAAQELVTSRRKAGNDMTKIQVWAYGDLHFFLTNNLGLDEGVARGVEMYFIGQESKRLQGK